MSFNKGDKIIINRPNDYYHRWSGVVQADAARTTHPNGVTERKYLVKFNKIYNSFLESELEIDDYDSSLLDWMGV